MVGRRYETGAAMRSPDGGQAGQASTGPASEFEQVAGALHEKHGEQLAVGSEKAGVPAEATAAVVLTESSQLRGVSEDRMAVRFEPYEFFRQTGRWLVATHRDQDAEYQVLAEARQIDPAAAHAATRMGLAQVSGAEADTAGYDNATAMFAGMNQGESAQIDGFLQVVSQHAELQEAMNASDWTAVAELRAGPGYGALGYDDALAAHSSAYKAISRGYGGGDDGDDDKPKKPRKSTKTRKTSKK